MLRTTKDRGDDAPKDAVEENAAAPQQFMWILQLRRKGYENCLEKVWCGCERGLLLQEHLAGKGKKPKKLIDLTAEDVTSLEEKAKEIDRPNKVECSNKEVPCDNIGWRHKVDNFEEWLNNLFRPLFEATLHPDKYPDIYDLLLNVVAFDSVDDESRTDKMCCSEAEEKISYWTKDQGGQPPYSVFGYYFWANIYQLNTLRKSLDLNTFKFRPHCGEAGPPDHLATMFLLADGINHGIVMKNEPSLQYLYYLTQIGCSVSPLSNKHLFLEMRNNPFYEFFERGLNVSLSTDDPLQFHTLNQPLLEEYTAAMQQWDITGTDRAEIMRNSVLQSGFTHAEKKKLIGEFYLLGGVSGNVPGNTDVPSRRAAFRHEARLEEYFWVSTKSKLYTKGPDDKLTKASFPIESLIPRDTRWTWKPSKDKQECSPVTWWGLVGEEKAEEEETVQKKESIPTLVQHVQDMHETCFIIGSVDPRDITRRRLAREARTRSLAARRRRLKQDVHAFVTQVNGVDVNDTTPSLRVLHHRRLANAASMAAKNVDVMSPDELTMHRRRMTDGTRALAALMGKIEEQQRKDRLCR